MEGYSEIAAIYFSIGEYTSYAKYRNGEIISASYKGSAPYSYLKGAMPKILRRYHSAEHQVYNAFQNKIKDLTQDSSLDALEKKIPSIAEAQQASAFHLRCGSTIFLFSALILILAALPNILDFHNEQVLFMLPWMLLSIGIARAVCYLVQHKFYLAKPNQQQLQLAIEALKEVINNARNNSK